uniref:Uncharacterized protein n=1 Tax=Cyprinus carpio TaxID=7962 RepID=A0A8C2CPU8_CYPCA
MIGDRIETPLEDDVWELCLKLREVVDLTCAPKINTNQVAFLKVLIEEYLQLRSTSFPGKPLQPKHHYLVHYPELILHFGPLIRLWTLLKIAVLAFKAQCAMKLHNFKNLCNTLAERHQFLQAYLHAGSFTRLAFRMLSVSKDFVQWILLKQHLSHSKGQCTKETKMDSIVSAIHTVLPQLDGKKREMLVDELVSKLGVEGPKDLQFVKEEDIAHLLSPIQYSNLESATSSPESEIVASSSTVFDLTQGTILCENSSWLDRFQVPWDKMRPTLKRVIDADKKPEPEDCQHMVRVIVDSMRVHCLNPSRKDCSAVAKEITQKYSGSFLDKTEEGEIIGCGYFSLMNQLKTRIEYVNRGNTLSRLRRPRCSRTSGDDQPSAGKCAKIDSYGCITWQPQEYPEGESSASLEEKRKEMVDLFPQEGPRATERGTLKELMTITYAKQREDINSDPPLSIIDISKKWPFLLLNNDLDKKGERLLEFFHVQIMKWSKEVKTVLKEALKDDRQGTDGLAAMLVMMAYFKEAEDSPFLLADATTAPADAEAHFSLPITPRLIVLGETVWSVNKWMLSIEGRVVIPHSPPIPDFTTALVVLFASFYVFNIEYQVEAATTLEFVQRFLVRINPESGKCSRKVQTSRKSGKNVKRKTSYMNPCVVAFMRDFTDFDWQNN